MSSYVSVKQHENEREEKSAVMITNPSPGFPKTWAWRSSMHCILYPSLSFPVFPFPFLSKLRAQATSKDTCSAQASAPIFYKSPTPYNPTTLFWKALWDKDETQNPTVQLRDNYSTSLCRSLSTPPLFSSLPLSPYLSFDITTPQHQPFYNNPHLHSLYSPFLI